MAAAVLQMAVLASARIEQRTEPVGGIGGGRRGNPGLAEDGVADLEVELALEIHIAGGEREGIGRGSTAARGGAAARRLFALLELGEVGGGPNQALDRRTGIFAVGLKRAGHKRQRRAKQDRAGKRR